MENNLLENEDFQFMLHKSLIKTVCAEGNLTDLTKLLTMREIDISDNDNELFRIACNNNHKEIIMFLLDHPNFIKTKGVVLGFYSNIRFRNAAVMPLLNEKFIELIKEHDNSFHNTFYYALEYKNYEVIDVILSQPNFSLGAVMNTMIFKNYSKDTILMEKIFNSQQFKQLIENNEFVEEFVAYNNDKTNTARVSYSDYPPYLKNLIWNIYIYKSLMAAGALFISMAAIAILDRMTNR